MPFAFTNHGHLPADELAALYNRCRAGLVLSLTNLSLLPAELLAAGCIPVMNDGENTRASCDSPCARFARPEPRALADELGAVVEHDDDRALEPAAAASVGPQSWDAGRRSDRGRHPAGPQAGRGASARGCALTDARAGRRRRAAARTPRPRRRSRKKHADQPW